MASIKSKTSVLPLMIKLNEQKNSFLWIKINEKCCSWSVKETAACIKSEASRNTLYSVTVMRITVSHCYMPHNTQCPPATQLQQTRQCVMLENVMGCNMNIS